MKKYLIFLLLFPSKIIGNDIIHEKIHAAPYNLPCVVEAFLNMSEEDIHSFSLLYRSKGSEQYMESLMMPIGRLKYRAEISGNFMVKNQVEYYLLLELSYGRKITFPENDAIYNPIIIQIELPTEKVIPATPSEMNNFDIVGLYPDIIIISPQPGERVRGRDLFIALSYFGEKDIDTTKVKVYLDGLDVSKRADIDSKYLSFLSKDTTPGMHTVTVNISNTFDQKYDDISWSFTVLPQYVTGTGLIRKQSGSMQANYIGESGENSALNLGELDLLYKVDLHLFQCMARYTLSSMENKYDQPRNRYIFDLRNELMSITLGDFYPSIDQYALHGHHVRGSNFNFDGGPLSLDIIQGNTARANQGNPSKNAIKISDIDSTTDIDNWTITLSRNNYTFQQELFGAKIGLRLGDKFYWDVNYIKVEDNIASVVREISDANIIIPTELQANVSSIRYDSLINLMNNNDYSTLSQKVDSINFSTENWIGTKPRDNFIYGSNMKFGFDDSRIEVSSGFSVSFLNRNKWNNLQSVSELDTFAVDTTADELFLDGLELDTTKSLSQYENYFNFGTHQQPMVPLMFQKNGAGIINMLNMSNLNRYIKLQFRYLSHRVELGSKRNGPDYYSILNPYLKTNFTESYFSDRFHLFQNKLLLYYKRSKIIEGIYSDQTSQIENRKHLCNIALFPGTGLPIFNFGFSSSNRSNNEDDIFDSITYPNTVSNDTTVTFVTKEETVNNLFNISMTNQFTLWVDQVLSVNILLFNLTDQLANKVNLDTLKSIGYLPKDAESESYGMSLKSVYNSQWESTVYFNISNYDYGRKGFTYSDDGIADYQNFRNLHLNFLYRPIRYITKLHIGLNHSYSWGSNSLTKYNFKIGAESELLDNLIIKLNFDYRIKFMEPENKGASELFIRAYLSYNIL